MTASAQARAVRCATALILPSLLLVAFSAAGAVAQDPAPREAKSDDAATRQYATAAALQNREQYELAIDEWRKFLESYPRDSHVERARHYLGVCYLQSKQYPQALAAFQKFVADYPQSTLDEASRFYLGLAQYKLARAGQTDLYRQAAATFAALAAKHPKGKQLAQALFYHGESLYAQGKKAEAARLYQQVVKQFPGDALLPDALYALGVAQDELGQAAAADATYQAWLEKFADQPLAAEVSLRRGETLVAQKKYGEAEKLFAAAAGRKGFALADVALLRQAAMLMERKDYSRIGRVRRAGYQVSPVEAQTGRDAGRRQVRLPARPLRTGPRGASPSSHWVGRTGRGSRALDRSLLSQGATARGRSASRRPRAARRQDGSVRGATCHGSSRRAG